MIDWSELIEKLENIKKNTRKDDCGISYCAGVSESISVIKNYSRNMKMNLRQKIIQACNQPTFTQGYDALEKVVKDEVREFAEKIKSTSAMGLDFNNHINKLLKEYEEGRI